MAVIYVTQPGAEIRKQGERLKIQWQGTALSTVLLREVERVVLLGPVQLSAGATRALLKRSIPVVFGTTRGRYCGMLWAGQERTELILKQVDGYRNMEYRLAIARAVAGSKIRHQRSLLRRYERNHPDAEIHKAADDITALLAHLGICGTISEIMGYEGQAAATYFRVFGRCLRQEGIVFIERNRRPPRDPVNALLSLGYMLVMGELVGALAATGLHVGLGFLHEVDPNRPSLALDVTEIFRQPIVDRLTLSLFNRRVFTPQDFQTMPDGGVRLKEDAFKRYMILFERTVTNLFKYPGGDQPTMFRQLFQNQAQALRTAVMERRVWDPITLDL